MASIEREKEATTIEQEELRGISRSVGEIEWLLMIVVLLYHAFGGIAEDDHPVTVVAMVLYALCIMGFRYANFFKHESRWKLAVETWIMTAFITWTLLHTGRLESPLLNSYLLVIITSALALGKLTTLLELMALIGACIVMLGEGETRDILTLKHAAGLFAQFAPFVLVAYITTMFASDIHYGLNQVKLLAETDELTKAYNRRGFAIIADRLFGQAVRYSRPISMLILDCDNLKQVNDNNGQQGRRCPVDRPGQMYSGPFAPHRRSGSPWRRRIHRVVTGNTVDRRPGRSGKDPCCRRSQRAGHRR